VVEWDVARRKQTIRHSGARDRTLILATGTEIISATYITYEIVDDDPKSAAIEYRCTIGAARADWKPRIESTARISMTRDEFVLVGDLNAFLGDEHVLTRKWERRVPRYFV
jgi:hypothetical protein